MSFCIVNKVERITIAMIIIDICTSVLNTKEPLNQLVVPYIYSCDKMLSAVL